MKPTSLKNSHFLLALLAILLTAGLVSWDSTRVPGHFQQPMNDTTPKKKFVEKEKKVRDLDDVLDELNEAELKVNIEKIGQEIAEAVKQIDANKIKLEIDKAMKEVDMEKIKREVQSSIDKVDFEKMKTELAAAMKEIDAAKIQKEVKESLEKVNWDKIQEEVDKAKNIDMKKLDEEMNKLSEEMKNLKPRIEKEMSKAREEIEKARAGIMEYKEFVDGLEQDGLINKKEGYSLKHKDGELFINGKKASEQVYNKYRSFLEKHKKFSIEKNKDDFNVNMD